MCLIKGIKETVIGYNREFTNQTAKKIFNKDSNSLVLVNTLSYSWSGSVKIPVIFHGYELLDNKNKNQPHVFQFAHHWVESHLINLY